MNQFAFFESPHRLQPNPDRIFVGWDRSILGSAASLLADRYARGSELRMGEVTVVLPGARAGRRLKEYLLDEAERRGARLHPPRVLTVGALPELLHPASRPVAGEALSRRVWARTLRGAGSERLQGLFAETPAEDDLLGWTRLAGTVAALHGEVGAAALRFAEVVRRCGEGLLFADTERWALLAELQDAYEAELARLGFADRELARIDALDVDSPVPDGEIWLVGVVEMPEVVARLLIRHREAGGTLHVLVQADEQEAAGFDELGRLRAEAWTGRAIPLRDDQIAVRGRPADQAGEVVRTLAGLDGQYAADQIAVAAPDEELLPYVEQALQGAAVQTHAAAGTPIGRSPVVRMLAAAADFLDGRRFDAAAALLRHPDLARALRARWVNSDDPAAAVLRPVDGHLEPLDSYFSSALPARLQRGGGGGARDTREARAAAALARALDHETMLGRFRGSRAVGEWMPAVMDFVAEVYSAERIDPNSPSGRVLLESCRYLRAAALELASFPDGLDESCSASTAIHLLLDEVAGAAIAPHPAHDPVELLGWLELRLDDAPVVIITGFNEPFLPESLNAHPFLPNSLRERLGLVCNRRRYARDAYELTALLSSREVVRAIAGRRGASGDPLRPSRLMFAVQGRALAERVQRFYAESIEARLRGGDASSTPNPFPLPPEPVLHAPEPIERLSITDFRGLIADPYAYALQRILRLSPLDDSAREMDALAFGNVAHDVLERFGRSDAASSTDGVALTSVLDDLLDDEVRARFGTGPLPAVRIQIEQLRARLHAFAQWQVRRVAEGWRVVAVECATPREGVPFDVDGETTYLTGRIDRIDYHPESRELLLLDYKTGDRGQSPEETHCRRRGGQIAGWTDLQLPLYDHILPHLLAAGALGDVNPGAVRVGYITLPRDLEGTRERLANWTRENLDEAVEAAREVIRELRKNEFIYNPDATSRYLDDSIASLLGTGYLESAAAAEEEEGV